MQNKTAFALGLVGGFLMIISGMTGGAGLWEMLLGWALSFVSVSPEVMFALNIFLTVLNFIGGFGGFVVILGSLLFFTDHVRIGKFLVSVGAGLGIVGLIFHYVTIFITEAWLLALILLLFPAPGIIGCIFALLAQFRAKSPESSVSVPTGGDT